MSQDLTKGTVDGEDLVAQYLRDPRADLKDLIVVHYAPMVERIARRFKGVEHVDDLTQVGYIGLLNALSKYDPQTGVRFNTYATHLVVGEIKHFLRDRSQTIRQPAWLQELRHKVQKASTSIQAETGTAPTERQIAEHIGVSESAVGEVFATQDLLRVGSLDVSPMDDEDSESDIDRLDSAQFCPGQLSVEDRVVLETAMRQLRDLEREVLVLFHFDSLNQTEIAHRLGISCNYVSHILRQSLAKLRRILSEEDRLDLALRPDDPRTIRDVVDQATGVYNESYLTARLTEELHRLTETGAELSLLVVEFTGLKSLGGLYGGPANSGFLADAADHLKSLIRGLDILCRTGSSGFAVVMPATGASVSSVAERIGRDCRNWLMTRLAPNAPVKVAVGYASAPDEAFTQPELMEIARARCKESLRGSEAA